MVTINNMQFKNDEEFNYIITMINRDIVDLQRKQDTIEKEIEVLKNKKEELIAEYNYQKSIKKTFFQKLIAIFA